MNMPALDTAPLEKKPRGRFWMLLVGFMILQLVAWTLWFTIAAKNPVAEVPLKTQRATPPAAP